MKLVTGLLLIGVMAGFAGSVDAAGADARYESLSKRKLSSLTPTEVAWLWNKSLTKGNERLAQSLTSKTSAGYVKSKWGTLKGLVEQFAKNIGKFVKVKTNIHEEIYGSSAIVIYRVQYGSEKSGYFIDKLFWEDGTWKLAPEHAKGAYLPFK